MGITKKDFEILHWIEYMSYNYPKLLSKQLGTSEDKAERKLLELKKRGLIKIEMREGKIDGSQLTAKGKSIWDDEKHIKWKEELGY